MSSKKKWVRLIAWSIAFATAAIILGYLGQTFLSNIGNMMNSTESGILLRLLWLGGLVSYVLVGFMFVTPLLIGYRIWNEFKKQTEFTHKKRKLL